MLKFISVLVLALAPNFYITQVHAENLSTTQNALHHQNIPPAQSVIFPLEESMKLVGKAKFTVFFWDIYNSSLYSPSGQFGHNTEEFVFNITYLRDIDNEDLLERTIEQWQHLGLPERAYQPYLNKLLTLWPDISKGDTLTMHVNSRGTHFYYNRALTGKINDDIFGQMFTNIWLSPKTSQPKLRIKLLGLSEP